MRVERSPADVVRLVTATAALLALLVVEWLFGDTLVAFSTELFRGLDALPQWIVDVVVVGTRVLVVVVLGGGLVWSVVHQRWRMLGTVALAAALAVAGVALLDALFDTDPGDAAVEVGVDVYAVGSDTFPTAAGVAGAVALVTAAAPWLTRRWRRIGTALLVGLAVTHFMANPASFETLRAVLDGWLVGAAVLVGLGAPSRRPTRDAVSGALGAVGLPLESLEPAGVDARGSTPYFGVELGGGKVFVKALGDDERSADLLFRLYRRVVPRSFGDEKPFSTLRRAVEHEALVAYAARDLGVRTPRMRAFAAVEPNGFVLAYDAIAGGSLDQFEDDDITDEVLASCWGLLAHLRRHRIAHRDLRLANIFLDDDREVWLIDFGFSELAAPDLLLATDVAELVASSSIPVGAERAVAHAAATVDPALLRQAVDRLQPWALSGATRTAMKERPGLLADVKARVSDAAGAA